jgi:TolB-like protein
VEQKDRITKIIHETYIKELQRVSDLIVHERNSALKKQEKEAKERAEAEVLRLEQERKALLK